MVLGQCSGIGSGLLLWASTDRTHAHADRKPWEIKLMGRNAKLRKNRQQRPINVRLAGEQAEVFDEQMESDREWFSGSNECVRFRPEISGEWNEYLMLGAEAPCIDPYDKETGEGYLAPLDWVCVVDIINAIKGGGPSGCRIRFRCPAPINAIIRQAMSEYAIGCTRLMFEAARQSTHQQADLIAAGGRKTFFAADLD